MNRYGIAPEVESFVDGLNRRQLHDLNHIGKLNYRVYHPDYLPGMQPINGDSRKLADLRHSLKIYICRTPRWNSVEALQSELARPNTHWTVSSRQKPPGESEPVQASVLG